VSGNSSLGLSYSVSAASTPIRPLQPVDVTRVLAEVAPGQRQLVLRPLQPEDREDLARAIDRLSETTRYHRFHSSGFRASRQDVDYLSSVDGNDHVAWCLIDRTTYEGAGLGRWIRDGNASHVAEAAVTVCDDFQGQGLSKVLLGTLMASSRCLGIDTLVGLVLNGNSRALRLMDQLGASMRPGDPGTAAAHLSTDPARLPDTETARTVKDWIERIGGYTDPAPAPAVNQA